MTRFKKLDMKGLGELPEKIAAFKSPMDHVKVKDIFMTLHAFCVSAAAKVEGLEAMIGVCNREHEIDVTKIAGLEKKIAELGEEAMEGVTKRWEEEKREREDRWEREMSEKMAEVVEKNGREVQEEVERLRQENETLQKELETLRFIQGKQEEEVKEVLTKHGEFEQQLKEEKVETHKWIDVVKRGGGTPKGETIAAALNEGERRKQKALNVIVRGLPVGQGAKEDVKTLMEKMEVEVAFTDAWRFGTDESRDRPLIIKFKTLGDRESLVKKRTMLKGTKIYVDDDLTPLQVEHRKEGMTQVMAARKEGKWAVYRDGKVMVRDRCPT